MATLLAVATGNFTASGSWALCDATAELDSEAANTAVGTSNLDSSTFTPGAITVDGVAVKIHSRASSPSGTFTVTLRNSTDTVDVASVTINVSDISASASDSNPGWYFLKFASSHLLIAGKAYLVRVVCSASGSQVTLFRDGTSNNWSRQLRTTTTQAPAAGDKLLWIGEHTGAGTGNDLTCTMQNTAATTFGSTSFLQSLVVGKRGTLTWGTSASTNYLLTIAGIVKVYAGGTWNQGTSGTPMPSTSTGVLAFDLAAAGDSGLDVNGTFNAYGATKTVVITKLNADAAASATSLTVLSTSGWAANDELVIAPTTRTASQAEKRTISTVDSGVAVTISSGLTNAHSGTSPTQAEVGNITRNVMIRGESQTLAAYIVFRSDAVVVERYVEHKWLSGNTTTFPKAGFTIAVNTGSLDVQFCSMHDHHASSGYGVVLGDNTNAYANITLRDNIVWDVQQRLLFLTANGGSALVFSGNLFMKTGSDGLAFRSRPTTFENNTVTGASVGAFIDLNGIDVGTFTGCVFHSNSSKGWEFLFLLTEQAVRFVDCVFWRNNGEGVYVWPSSVSYSVRFSGCVFFGNNNANLYLKGSYDAHLWIELDGCTLSGDSTFSTNHGVYIEDEAILPRCEIDNSDFGTASGIKVAHATADITFAGQFWGRVFLRHTKLASGTEISGGTGSNIRNDGFIRVQRSDQSAGVHKSYFRYGTVERDASVFNTAAPSQKITPNSASFKIESGPMRREVDSGGTATFAVYVRKDAAYNGAQPRLILRKNPAVGITADVVLDTMTVGTGTWEQLTGTSASASDDGALEAYVDCDGTAGYINVDDWS